MLATLPEGSVFGLIAMGLFRIARKLRIDPFAAPFAGVSPAAAITQSLRERSVLIGGLARRVGIPWRKSCAIGRMHLARSVGQLLS